MRHGSTEEGAAVQPEREGSSRIWSMAGPALAGPQKPQMQIPCSPSAAMRADSKRRWSKQ
jgi:hypothetical protein